MTHARSTIVIALIFIGLVWNSANSAERVPWTSSHVQGAPRPPLPYRVERVFGEHTFDRPVVLTNAPGTESMFLLELPGRIYELHSETEGDPTLIADLSKHAHGLEAAYGLAFHPKFQDNRYLYACYKRGGDAQIGSVVSRFTMTSTNPMEIQSGSEQILFTWLAGGHNGGCLKFGLDGFLYISAGDAADPFPPDPLKAGQDLSNLLSTIMRIDVDHEQGELPYAIPADNPFVDHEGARGEIWAYGFRNPWRMAFDRKSGDLWVGDVGWELWEMIHHARSGGNYGWSLMEGPHVIHADGMQGPTPVTKPVASHAHSEARSITGGTVFYGDRFPELQGAYIYGDHVTGRIWSLRRIGESYTSPKEIARAPLHIICFGQHHNGEVYIVGYGGTIHRFVANDAVASNLNFPRTLGVSGIFDSVREHVLAPGVLPYSIIAEPWMDGATAERFVGIPDNGRIGIHERTDAQATWDGKHRGSWKFPLDTVLGKTISWRNRRAETQLLHFDGQAWQPYTYIWNEDQTDAHLADDVSAAIDLQVGEAKTRWPISNRTDCMVCHSSAADMVLGFKPYQLGTRMSPAIDQLEQFEDLGLFEHAPPQHNRLVNPYDDAQDLTARVRAYLHVNCAHCHRRDGGGAVAMDVVFDQTLNKTRLIGEKPTQGLFGLENAKVVAQGDPFRSVLFYRFNKMGPGRMPRLGSNEVDPEGSQLFYDWIVSLGPSDRDLSNRQDAHLKSLRRAIATGDEALIKLLSPTEHSLMTSHAMHAGQVDVVTRNKVIEISASLPDHDRDLFERYLPAESRTQRMGDMINVADILARPGNVDRGRELYQAESLACKVCHSVERGKDSLGPNLASLPEPQYSHAVLLQNILEPSLKIADEYKMHLVQTVDGNVLSGVTKVEGNILVLRDAQNHEHRVALMDVELQKPLAISIMPDRLLNPLTVEQAADLLAYLSSLKPKH